MQDVSVVVGTFNRVELLKRCVESVVSGNNRLAHLYVTDAGSTDGTIEYLQSVKSDRVVPLLTGEKIGQAKSLNEVFRKIETPYTCWLSDDNEVVGDGLDVAAGVLDQDQRIGMVALKVKDLIGPFVDAPYIGGVSKLGILNVNQGMLPTKVLSEVGYFSEQFRDYGIDPDLTAKVLLSGYDIVYTRQVAVHHYRQWETDKSRPEYWSLRKRQEMSVELYLAKYGRVLGPAPLWMVKKAAWRLFRDMAGRRFNINGKSRFFHQLPRDWSNVLTGRYISLFDALQHSSKDHHLRQRAPRIFRPKTLPVDPDIEQVTGKQEATGQTVAMQVAQSK